MTQLRKRGAQRLTGDLHESCVRRAHFQDQENGTGNRQCCDKKAAHRGAIERSEQSEADENSGEPENEDNQ